MTEKMEANNLHCLLIDDDELMAETHKHILERAGFKTSILTSSKQALAQVHELQPDCIISDLSMPDMDGFQLFQSIRKLENIKSPTFVVLTAKVFEFDHRQAVQLGVDGYLIKPST